ncbi:hypothetical protein LOK49_LG03G03728 [Camellia lanceoleosa]|uniref:Uncharacterized protein n=1 Tax=Camellia lanceoleosa TaxID=1840588 RepID=A0ACC0ICD1_9ERIC|nr:hypothetical protein LOK49_LG03G03728 [Camellia lanceoleosa]
MGYYGGGCKTCYVNPGPQPYSVLLILALIAIFLLIQWLASSCPTVVEEPKASFNWLLLFLPIALLFAVRCLSSFDGSRRPCPRPPCNRCCRPHCYCL